MRTRREHLEWCKARAREYLERGDLDEAVASMVSDLSKHEKTADIQAGHLCAMALFAAQSPRMARAFVEGF